MRRYADSQDAETVSGSGDHSVHSQSAADVNAASGKYSVGSSSSHRLHQHENKFYDIFINHRGPDTKGIFVTHLEEALKGKGYNPFVDKSMKEGEHAFEEINLAIQNTPVHLAIFSPHYAESEYCLDELVDMVECRKNKPEAVTLLPIFFNVEPKDLRNCHLFGNPFYRAFKKHEKNDNYSDERISRWKEALHDAADWKGFELVTSFSGDTNKLKNEIVARVQEIIAPRSGLSWRQPVPQPDVGLLKEPGDNVPILYRSQSQPCPKPSCDGDLLARPSESHQPEIEAVRQPNTAAQPENHGTVTFNSTDRPLRILVLGNSNSVEVVVSHTCGAGRRQTQVEDYVHLTESRSSSPPMCLYYLDTEWSDRNDFTDVIKTFVKDRNERWHRKQVETLCMDKVHRRPPGERPELLPHAALRLHMVWFVCQEKLDLPNSLEWPEITKNLHDLPMQIVVTLDSEYDRIFEQGIRLFPNAQKLEELIVKFDLEDGNLKENLWRTCWEAKTRAEIGNAARIIRGIRKELGSAGISIPQGVGSPPIPPDVSLSLSGEFVLEFFCKYWEIPNLKSSHGILKEVTTFLEKSGNKYRYSIKPRHFVKFCLQVAAVILYNARDNDKNPKYVCDWPDSTSESSFQLLKTETEKCYNRYFPRSITDLSYYDKMEVEDIRALLQSIFERENFERLEGQDRSCCSWFVHCK